MIMKRAYLGLILPIIGLALGCSDSDSDGQKGDNIVPDLNGRTAISVYNNYHYHYNDDGSFKMIELEGVEDEIYKATFSYNPFEIEEQLREIDYEGVYDYRFKIYDIKQNSLGYITALTIGSTYQDIECSDTLSITANFKYDREHLIEAVYNLESTVMYNVPKDSVESWCEEYKIRAIWEDGNMVRTLLDYEYADIVDGEAIYEPKETYVYLLECSDVENRYNQVLCNYTYITYTDFTLAMSFLAEANYFGIGGDMLVSSFSQNGEVYVDYEYELSNDGYVTKVIEHIADDDTYVHNYKYLDNQGRSEYVTLPQESMKPRPFLVRRSKHGVK